MGQKAVGYIGRLEKVVSDLHGAEEVGFTRCGAQVAPQKSPSHANFHYVNVTSWPVAMIRIRMVSTWLTVMMSAQVAAKKK